MEDPGDQTGGDQNTMGAVKKPNFFVYLGPSLRGVIQKATIFEGTRSEMEAFFAPAIEKSPRIKNLLVSGDTLPQDRINVNTPGNYLYEEYRRFVSELKNKEVKVYA